MSIGKARTPGYYGGGSRIAPSASTNSRSGGRRRATKGPYAYFQQLNSAPVNIEELRSLPASLFAHRCGLSDSLSDGVHRATHGRVGGEQVDDFGDGPGRVLPAGGKLV